MVAEMLVVDECAILFMFGVCSLFNVCLMVLKLLEWPVWLSDFYLLFVLVVIC